MSTIKNFFRNVYLKSVFELPKNVKVNGNMEAVVGGYIDGAIEGDLKTDGDITVGKNASINGNVFAINVMIYGKVYGNVVCTGKAMIAAKGFVKGNISGIIIDIEEGALVEGIIKQRVEKETEVVYDAPDETGTDITETPAKKETSAGNPDLMEKWF